MISDIEHASPGYVCIIRGISTKLVSWIRSFSSYEVKASIERRIVTI